MQEARVRDFGRISSQSCRVHFVLVLYLAISVRVVAMRTALVPFWGILFDARWMAQACAQCTLLSKIVLGQYCLHTALAAVPVIALVLLLLGGPIRRHFPHPQLLPIGQPHL